MGVSGGGHPGGCPPVFPSEPMQALDDEPSRKTELPLPSLTWMKVSVCTALLVGWVSVGAASAAGGTSTPKLAPSADFAVPGDELPDFKNARPLPLPSAPSPGSSQETPDRATPGPPSTVPGAIGTGDKQEEILVPPS